MIPMTLRGVRVETPTNQPIVLLQETSGVRYLPIWILREQAEAIAMATAGIVPERPMTHDLMRDLLTELGVRVTRVSITEVRDRIYHATLDLQRNGETHVISCRPSDAIALAVRVDAPLFAADAVLEEAGILLADDVEEEDEVERFREFLDTVTPEDFSG